MTSVYDIGWLRRRACALRWLRLRRFLKHAERLSLFHYFTRGTDNFAIGLNADDFRRIIAMTLTGSSISRHERLLYKRA